MKPILLGLLALLAGCSTQPNPTVDDTPLSMIRAHALAFGGILSTINREPLDALTAGPISLEMRQSHQKTLATSWDVNSRSSFLESLAWIEQGGHRKMLWSLTEQIKKTPLQPPSPKSLATPNAIDDYHRLKVAEEVLHEAPTQYAPITAWDYGRYINLCRWGYICGYITEEEAWDRIMPVARFLRATYGSWEEFSADYLRGRDFWSLTQTIKTGAAHKKAAESLADNHGPWSKSSWMQSLGVGPVAHDPFWLSVRKTPQP